MTELRPHPGPQEDFLACSADIALYGGAAGGGKTWALLYDAIRAVADPEFRGVIFRRTVPNITNEGALWDESKKLYPLLGAKGRSHPKHQWSFPSGASITMTHLQHADTVEDHKGSQYAWVAFDELTEFEESQFWYMLSRMRSSSGWRPWLRATTNPDASSWVRELVDWWIGEDGYAIPERSGVIRYMERVGDHLVWHDEPGPGRLSFTFIVADLDDNPTVGEDYAERLAMLGSVEREKLLGDPNKRGGNWNISALRGLFAAHRIRTIHPRDIPEGLEWVRYWDLADSEPTKKRPEPDETASAKVAVHAPPEGLEVLYIADSTAAMLQGAAKREHIKGVASEDGPGVRIGLEQEPGASGKELANDYRDRTLSGYAVEVDRPTGSKEVRAGRWLPHAERGDVFLVLNPDGTTPRWHAELLTQLEQFPHGKKDRVDAISGGYNLAHNSAWIWAV